MKILIILSVISIFLSADPFKLTANEQVYVDKLYNSKKINKRFENYNLFFEKAKEYNEIKKLNRVNNYVNRIISKNDETNKWSTPKSFLIKGRGDCEDYAITKYFSLQKLGIDTAKLYLSVVKVKGSKNFHMVLMHINKDNIPMILDNLSWKMLPLNKRKNFEFKFSFNEKASYILKNDILVEEKGIRRAEVKMFRDMLKRVN